MQSQTSPEPQTQGAAPAGAYSSPAAARNRAPILEVLKAHLPARGRVLEVAGGSGEHAAGFARAFPGLSWRPTDPAPEALESMAAWRRASGLANLAEPQALDMLDPAGWPDDEVDAIVCINMIHISPWAATQGLMSLAGRLLRRPGGLLVLYGPYRETGVELAPSNVQFDAGLRARNPEWGLRDVEAVAQVAKGERLVMTRRVAMPANNLVLLFRAV